MSEAITTNELKIMFEDMRTRSDERHAEYKEHDKQFLTMLQNIEAKIDTTLEQARKTNGRVNKHDWQFKVAYWGLGAVWTLILIGVPLAWQAMKLQIEIISNRSSEQALSKLEEKYNLIIQND